MAANYLTVQIVKLYEFGKNSYWLNIVYNKQYNRYSLDITRKLNYTKNGEIKEEFCTTFLNLTAAKSLVDQLPLAYQFAKTLQDSQGVEIYRLFCLIFKTLYTFPHTSAEASDRKRLGRWTSQGHCRSWS